MRGMTIEELGLIERAKDRLGETGSITVSMGLCDPLTRVRWRRDYGGVESDERQAEVAGSFAEASRTRHRRPVGVARPARVFTEVS